MTGPVGHATVYMLPGADFDGVEDGDVPTFDASLNRWIPAAPSGGVPAGTQSGQVPVWNNSTKVYVPTIPYQAPTLEKGVANIGATSPPFGMTGTYTCLGLGAAGLTITPQTTGVAQLSGMVQVTNAGTGVEGFKMYAIWGQGVPPAAGDALPEGYEYDWTDAPHQSIGGTGGSGTIDGIRTWIDLPTGLPLNQATWFDIAFEADSGDSDLTVGYCYASVVELQGVLPG